MIAVRVIPKATPNQTSQEAEKGAPFNTPHHFGNGNCASGKLSRSFTIQKDAIKVAMPKPIAYKTAGSAA